MNDPPNLSFQGLSTATSSTTIMLYHGTPSNRNFAGLNERGYRDPVE